MTQMPLKVDRTIYSNEETQKGFNVSFKERDKDYKLVIKRVRKGNVIGGAIYYESLPKYESFHDYFRFVIETIQNNIQKVENLHFWNFGESVFKHLLQRRS